ncbi:MAG: cupin domain-containing protein [Desulfomicrobium sp.]|nr:cupin domain-containing protein [Pseudomonadota bacterium]MBV1710900.1 cupin domain-containing protein [Desulfomicrobium sp.]MBU4571527.1 cupin domain-containing protein [Pseudomonadota bacterium]MBU4594515.1 cupin domain-containing protein [Pseudomonadota bacterium]MBV1718633.1 cupin domain-containing protein [Desulfomicrobium sp.]
MTHVFPEPITNLPEADIPLDGITAYLSQSDSHQILFMQFEKDADLPEHSHAAQIGIVLEGNIELLIDGTRHLYTKGDRYYIPDGVKHSGKIYAGYADITFFNDPNRYAKK